MSKSSNKETLSIKGIVNKKPLSLSATKTKKVQNELEVGQKSPGEKAKEDKKTQAEITNFFKLKIRKKFFYNIKI